MACTYELMARMGYLVAVEAGGGRPPPTCAAAPLAQTATLASTLSKSAAMLFMTPAVDSAVLIVMSVVMRARRSPWLAR